MTFAPQCTKRWQLYEQMARVLKMCEEAGFDRPWECVKCSGRAFPIGSREWPDFQAPPEYYEFALAIVEGRPVFRGDEPYFIDTGEQFTVGGWDEDFNSLFVHGNIGISFNPDHCTWNPPHRTIEINGVKVNPAGHMRIDSSFGGVELRLFFVYQSDAEAFKAAMEGKK